MPRRFFRRFALKRHELTEQRFIAPIAHWLHDHQLWGIRRKSAVPAVAWGVFVGWMPVPGHVLIAILGSLLIRCNIPVAALATFISNPVTVGPMYYFSYRVGARLLGLQTEPFAIELSINWLQTTFATIWQPLLLGSVLVGSICSLIAYVLLDVLWRSSISDYKSRKRSDRQRRSEER